MVEGKETDELPARMLVIRSFDVNRPGTQAAGLCGGVAGGAVVQGVLKVGEEVEVRPHGSHSVQALPTETRALFSHCGVCLVCGTGTLC